MERRVALRVGDVDSNGGEVVPVFLGLQQGLPPVKAQSDPVHEAGHPIASDHLAMLVLLDQGLIAIGIIPQLGDDLIVAAQDGANDPVGFLLGQELWGLVPQIRGNHSLGLIRSGPMATAVRKPSRLESAMLLSGAPSDVRNSSSSWRLIGAVLSGLAPLPLADNGSVGYRAASHRGADEDAVLG